MLLVEQPDAAKEVTGQSGWRTGLKGLNPIAPLLIVLSAMCVELGVYRLWLNDQLFSAAGVLRLLLFAAFPFIAIMAAVFVTLLFDYMPVLGTKLAKRTLRLEDEGIKLSHTKYDRVRWSQVQRWLLAPIPGHEEFVTLTLECGSGTRPNRRYWSLILESRDQKQTFLSEVEHLRQPGRASAPVIELVQPVPERPHPQTLRWTLAVSFYLLVHGLPLFLAGVLPHGTKDLGSHYSPPEQAKMEQVVGPVIRGLHIRTQRQLRALFWFPGGLLTAAAIVVSVWGDKRHNRETEEINRVFDQELKKITRRGSLPLAPVGFEAHPFT